MKERPLSISAQNAGETDIEKRPNNGGTLHYRKRRSTDHQDRNRNILHNLDSLGIRVFAQPLEPLSQEGP
jgi:hypothetical protein